MQLHDNVVEDMLANITDPKLRDAYGEIINGKTTHFVHCNSVACGGRVIAYINADGLVRETKPVLSDDALKGVYSSGLEGSRQRLDGHLGFRCYCGNNSILADEEKGIIDANVPSKQDLYRVADRLSRRTRIALPTVGDITIDGFTKEKI